MLQSADRRWIDRRRGESGTGSHAKPVPLREADDLVMATFAHELRAPLSTLHATLEVLSTYPAMEPDEVEQFMGRLRRSVTWLNRLVDNLGAWASSKSGGMQLNCSTASVLEWIEPAIALTQPLFESKHQRVRLICPSPIPVVVGDALRLSQVVVNLLTNAHRYAPEGDVVDVRVTTDGGRVLVQVSDHGPGIPAAEQHRIFAAHARGAIAQETVPDGEGLGLHIVRSIVDLHQGTIDVSSTEGRGATFSVSLPRVDDHLMGDPIVAECMFSGGLS